MGGLTRRQFLAGLAALGIGNVPKKRRVHTTVAPAGVGGVSDVPRVDVTLIGPRAATPAPNGVSRAATIAAPTILTPSTGSGTFPFLISTDFGSGRASEAAQVQDFINNRNGSGWTHYITTANPLAWDNVLQTVAAALPNFPMVLQLTSRNYSDAGMDSVLASLPNAWRPGFTYNYFQEPEDNLEGNTAGQAAYRATYTSAANRIRAWNTANPTRAVSLPYIELAEYSLELLAGGNTARSPDKFRPPNTDYAGVLWSLFEYGEASDSPTFSRLTTQVNRIANAMATYFPGKEWGTMGWAYTLEPVAFTDARVETYTATQRQRQASWLTQSYNRSRAAGANQMSWYNVKFAGSGGASGEGRIEVIPETLAAYNALDRSL